MNTTTMNTAAATPPSVFQAASAAFGPDELSYLVKGLIRIAALAIEHPNYQDAYTNDVINTLHLVECLIPDELQMVKAFE